MSNLKITNAQRARWKWILSYMRAHGPVDILNADFVWSYCEYTKAKSKFMMIGAPRCNQLTKDLSFMKFWGFADRYTTGISGLSGQGFPKWVYSYTPGKHAEHLELS